MIRMSQQEFKSAFPETYESYIKNFILDKNDILGEVGETGIPFIYTGARLCYRTKNGWSNFVRGINSYVEIYDELSKTLDEIQDFH